MKNPDSPLIPSNINKYKNIIMIAESKRTGQRDIPRTVIYLDIDFWFDLREDVLRLLIFATREKNHKQIITVYRKKPWFYTIET